jgi:hypothetical protein
MVCSDGDQQGDVPSSPAVNCRKKVIISSTSAAALKTADFYPVPRKFGLTPAACGRYCADIFSADSGRNEYGGHINRQGTIRGGVEDGFEKRFHRALFLPDQQGKRGYQNV